MYKIVRFYANAKHRSRTIKSGLSLAQAQAHCEDPESSSSTAKSGTARAVTRRMGRWFDGYTEE